MSDLAVDVETIRRGSRRAAILGSVAGILIIVAIGGSLLGVQTLRSQLERDVKSLEDKKSSLAGQNAALAAANEALHQKNLALQDANAQAIVNLEQGHTETAVKVLSAQQAVAGDSVARVYFQISSEQIPVYRRCEVKLNAAGYRVPPFQIVPDLPTQAQIRYYSHNRQDDLSDIEGVLKECLGVPVSEQYFGDRYSGIDPLNFEVWLPRSLGEP